MVYLDNASIGPMSEPVSEAVNTVLAQTSAQMRKQRRNRQDPVRLYFAYSGLRARRLIPRVPNSWALDGFGTPSKMLCCSAVISIPTTFLFQCLNLMT